MCSVFFFQAEDGIRDLVRSRGLGDVYKRQLYTGSRSVTFEWWPVPDAVGYDFSYQIDDGVWQLSLIHI